MQIFEILEEEKQRIYLVFSTALCWWNSSQQALQAISYIMKLVELENKKTKQTSFR
jgi:hypothetical protein